MNNTFPFFLFPKPRSQVWILIYRKWSIKESFCDVRFWASKHKSGKISVKRIRATSSCEQQGGKTNSATRLASGKGTRHCSTVLGSATTGKQDSTQTWTSTVF